MIDIEQLIAEAVARELDRRGVTAKPANDVSAITVKRPTLAFPEVRPPATPLEGVYVYFIVADNAPLSPVKIGYAVTVRKRLSEVRACSANIVRLIGWYWSEDPQAAEADAHARLARFRTRGEWFASSPSVLKFLRERNQAT